MTISEGSDLGLNTSQYSPQLIYKIINTYDSEFKAVQQLPVTRKFSSATTVTNYFKFRESYVIIVSLEAT